MKRPYIRPSQRESITWARICKRLGSPGIDSKEPIPPAYNVAWGAGTSNRVVIQARQAGNRFLGSLKALQIRAQVSLYFCIIVKRYERYKKPMFFVLWQWTQAIEKTVIVKLFLRFFYEFRAESFCTVEKKRTGLTFENLSDGDFLYTAHCNNPSRLRRLKGLLSFRFTVSFCMVPRYWVPVSVHSELDLPIPLVKETVSWQVLYWAFLSHIHRSRPEEGTRQFFKLFKCFK